jgi:choline dehydrogenase-like flavoprotein
MADTATPTRPEPRTENGRGLSPFALIGEKGPSSKGVQAQPGYALLREQLWVLIEPVTWLQLFRSKFDWDYLTEPQPELNGRRIYWPRGKTLGGSSSLNAMMWVRGFAADYDEWAQHAGHEWAFSRGRRVLQTDRQARGRSRT